jgi:hypothetical protein
MRFVKLAVISIVVIFIILTAISSLLPSKVLVSRAVDAKTSVAETKSQLYNLNSWQYWMSDANGNKAKMKFDVSSNMLSLADTKISVQHISDTTLVTNWIGNTVMLGTFRIIDHHTPDSLITIQWQMEQHVKWYPWEKFASITKDELWGASMEKSLDNLKKLLEEN